MNNTTVYYVDNFPKTNPFRMPAPSELLDIFPEAVPYARKRLKELDETHTIYSKLYKAKLQLKINEIYENDIEDKDFAVYFWNLFIYELPLEKIKDKIEIHEKTIKTYEWKKRPKNSGDITDVEIAHAKEYPIKNILSEPPDRAGFIRCVFHEEKTPSFRVYENENRYHCFGCGEGGDVIDLTQHIYKLKFLDAVRRLI